MDGEPWVGVGAAGGRGRGQEYLLGYAESGGVYIGWWVHGAGAQERGLGWI